MATNVIHLEKRPTGKYWTRVDRSLCWLGDTDEEQKRRQEQLAAKTVGVAGCGGIGGALAVRLARLGVQHIKVADPDTFDWTNINRQMGATKDTVGQNKAKVVGHLAYDLAGDVAVDIFPDGITRETAAEFAAGCDLIFDQMDFYLLDERYALHDAFRSHSSADYILSAWCIGWGTSVFKWARNGMPIQEYFGLPGDAPMTPDTIRHLMTRYIPKTPPFPSPETIEYWFTTRRTVPLFAGTPPIAEAFVTRAVMLLLDMEGAPYATPLPTAPDCYVYDTMTLDGGVLRYDSGDGRHHG